MVDCTQRRRGVRSEHRMVFSSIHNTRTIRTRTSSAQPMITTRTSSTSRRVVLVHTKTYALVLIDSYHIVRLQSSILLLFSAFSHFKIFNIIR